MNGFELAKSICEALLPGEDSIGRACERLLWIGGVDTEKLDVPMLIAGLEDQNVADWKELHWSSTETLPAFFIDPDVNFSPIVVCAGVVALVIYSHSTRRMGVRSEDLTWATAALDAVRWGLTSAPAGAADELLSYIVQNLGKT